MTRGARPTREELLAAINGTLPDVIGYDLAVLFSGINPGLYSAAVGYHFARPGNRFWPALYGSGFTPRLFDPSDGHQLLELGYGLTNVVPRATAAASDLAPEEFVTGGKRLRAKLRRYRPRYLAILGMGAYRAAFDRPRASLGLQDETIERVPVWVLPSSSGLNAYYQIDRLVEELSRLRKAAAGK